MNTTVFVRKEFFKVNATFFTPVEGQKIKRTTIESGLLVKLENPRQARKYPTGTVFAARGFKAHPSNSFLSYYKADALVPVSCPAICDKDNPSADELEDWKNFQQCNKERV